MDVNKMGAALGFPGIDPRRHVVKGTVTAIKITAAGAFADVSLFPNGDEETFAIGGLGACDGGGIYVPLQIDDLVYVVMPEGNAENGGLIIGGPWDQGDPLPAEAVANPDDMLIAARRGAGLRLRTISTGDATAKSVAIDSGATVDIDSVGDTTISAGGNAVLESAGITFVGAGSATLAAARIGDTVSVTIGVGQIMVPIPSPPGYAPNAVPITLPGTITSGSAKVRIA